MDHEDLKLISTASVVTAKQTAPVAIATAPMLIPSPTNQTPDATSAPSATPADIASDKLPLQPRTIRKRLVAHLQKVRGPQYPVCRKTGPSRSKKVPPRILWTTPSPFLVPTTYLPSLAGLAIPSIVYWRRRLLYNQVARASFSRCIVMRPRLLLRRLAHPRAFDFPVRRSGWVRRDYTELITRRYHPDKL